MRAKSLLVVGIFLALALFGSQILAPSSRAFTLEANVKITPSTVNLNMQGDWITAHLGLPEGYNVADINPETILLENIFKPDATGIEEGKLTIRFEASMVIDYLWTKLYHMAMYRASIDLTITGQLYDGTKFTGTDTIIIMNP